MPSLASEAHAQAYEPWFTFFRWGLGSVHTLPVSASMIALFYLAMALTFKPERGREVAVCLLLLANPAVQLGVERANFDLLISALLCLAAWLLARGPTRAAVAGCLTLAFTTALKLYTAFACVLAWAIARPPRLCNRIVTRSR